MVCSECGVKLKDGAKFCIKCGNKIESKSLEEQVDNNLKVEMDFAKRVKNKKQKKTIWCLGVVMFLIVLFVLFYKKNDYEKFVEFWESEDYSKANELYQAMIDDDMTLQEIENYLINCFEREIWSTEGRVLEKMKELEKYEKYIPSQVEAYLLHVFDILIKDYYERKITGEEMLQQFGSYKDLIPEKYVELENIVNKEDKKYDNVANLAMGNELCGKGEYARALYFYYLAASNGDENAMEKGRECSQMQTENAMIKAKEFAERENYDEAVDVLLNHVDSKEETFFLEDVMKEEIKLAIQKYGMKAGRELLETHFVMYEMNCYMAGIEPEYSIEDITNPEIR